MERRASIPLLKSSNPGDTSSLQTTGNIIVSVVGTGILGLPFSFRIAGWLTGSIGVSVAGFSICCCMLKLVECRNKVASEGGTFAKVTYGDLGYKSLGRMGRFIIEFLILISQCGGSVAYLLFITQSLSSIFGRGAFIYMLLLVLIQIALSWIQTLSALSPFSIFANVCNAVAMAIVLREDLKVASTSQIRAVASDIGGFPFAAGMAVFCFEGFGMTLPLEASMRERSAFPKVLGFTTAGITVVYVLFGLFGYMAYGDQTKDIVTLNLPPDWSAIAVQMGICLGLVFTLPVMVHPVHEIVEGKVKASKWFENLWSMGAQRLVICAIRAVVVVGLGVVASCVPSFGVFASFVGSTVCALISFVMPAICHLKILGSSLELWQRVLDYGFLLGGLSFAAYGTYNVIFGIPV